LDAKLRVQMRAEIARTTRQMGVTTIYVTHDQTEAMTLGHRVAVMKKGVLQQVAEPQELYDRPANLFVAGFIGSPAMNPMQGVFTEDTRELARDAGTDLAEAATAPAGTVVVGRFSPRSRAREGAPVQVAVDVSRLHVFDLDTGRAIW